jgi:hypothetical protein
MAESFADNVSRQKSWKDVSRSSEEEEEDEEEDTKKGSLNQLKISDMVKQVN